MGPHRSGAWARGLASPSALRAPRVPESPFLSLVLLAAGVIAAVVGAARPRARAVAPLLALAAVTVGQLSPSAAGAALEPLLTPLAFVLAAVPLAVLLGELGFFAAVAAALARRGWITGGLWVMAALTVAVLNLDAAVVLLTPLYIEVARRAQLDPFALALQPAVLALLASSPLPVSNLTNLIAAERTGATSIEFLTRLGPATLAACAVGWLAYRRRFPPQPPSPTAHEPVNCGALILGSLIIAALAAAFVTEEQLGLAPWQIALLADGVLIVVVRRLPWRSVPLSTTVLVLSLGVLAAAAATDATLAALVPSSAGALGALVIVPAVAIGANLVNNLPAALLILQARPGTVDCELWALLLGLNLGPGLLLSGSLSTLLWLDILRRENVPADATTFLQAGIRIVLPSLLAATLVLCATNAVNGCP